MENKFIDIVEMDSEKNDFVNSEESQEKKGLKISETWLYKTFLKVAKRLINKPLSILRLLKKVAAHIQRYDSIREFTRDAKEHLLVLVRMVNAYANGKYRAISFTGIIGTLAALLYFVAPLDFIPDFLIFGLVDDVALIMWIYANYKSEIDAFLSWEDEQKIRVDVDKNERI